MTTEANFSSLRSRSTSSTGTAAAPVTARRSELVSYSARSAASNVWKMAGGPGSIVMRSWSTRAITDGASNTGCGTMTEPVRMHASTPDLSPAVWKKGYAIR